ncbi:MAG: type I-E CRISPR-associated protein Cse1/CasA [Acidobacteria bacterium]|nr:type I-E CRISPR-associated protein Cse1/CasA [Acidobacteriota bacterium]
MHNLLTDPLIRVRLTNGASATKSLPEVYEALSADRIAAFSALRPHQRHAWHAFLAQLGVIAVQRSGGTTLPRRAGEWCALLRGLTPGFNADEPWRLVVDDPAQPAFMQCPAPNGIRQYRGRVVTPDDLDILVTAKNHDVKRTVAAGCAPDDWMLALIDLQTMAGFLGAGNYGIARMNGGFSARPCLGLAPTDGGLGAHLFSDMQRMLAGRTSLLDRHPEYFDPEHGLALLWLEPWDGATALDLRQLDPFFIEICRRVRLRLENRAIVAWTAASKTARVAAKEARGNVGDFWTPVSKKDAVALSLSGVGFRYDRLAKLMFDRKSYDLPPAMRIDSTRQGPWKVVARGVAGGQGKTEGYHERSDIAFDNKTTVALGRQAGRDALEEISKAQIEEIEEVEKALRFGIAVAASGGKPAEDLAKTDRMHANPYARRLDEAANAEFFSALDRRFVAADDEQRAAAARAEFVRDMIGAAHALLDEAIDAVPCPAMWRYRARARATSAFYGRLRRPRSVFSDQPEIFEAQEAHNAA